MQADRSMYSYAWDLVDTPPSTTQHLKDMGITSITLAMSYHAGKFLRTGTTAPRVIFPEDGVVYFQPSTRLLGKITPKPATDERLLQVAHQCASILPMRAWTVLFHNTRLGYAHPEAVTRNAWGDPYWYSLCPSHESVREYALNLCQDLDQHSAISELVLESPTWLPFAHGYHHEFAQVSSNSWLDSLLGLCFCDACQQRAKQEGIDGQALAAWVRQRVESYLASGVDASAEQAHHWLHLDLIQQPDLLAWIQFRQRQVTDLVKAIKQQVKKPVWIIPTVQRPTAAAWLEGTHLKAMAYAADGLEVPFYEPNVKSFAADVWHTVQQVGDSQRIRAILRPATPDLGDGEQLDSAHQVLQQFGIRHSAYYNFGLMRPDRLQHLARSLTTLAQQG